MMGTPTLPVWWEPWRERAACRDTDPDDWFTYTDPDHLALLRDICNACPVREPCLEDTLRYSNTADRWGVFAGRTPEERKTLRRLRKEQAA